MPKVLNAPINIGTAPTNYGDALRQAGFEPLIVSTSNQLDLIGEPTENLLVLIEANNISPVSYTHLTLPTNREV